MRVQPAFLAQRAPQIGDGRIVDAAGEIDQYAVRAEVGDIGGIEVVDAGAGAALQQRHPVVIGAHVHAPLVAAEREGGIVHAATVDVAAPVDIAAIIRRARQRRVEHVMAAAIGAQALAIPDSPVIEAARRIHAQTLLASGHDGPGPRLLLHRPW